MAKKKIRVIDYEMDFTVNAIGLVDLPAIESDYICLSAIHAQRKLKLSAAVKEGERRMLYGAVMIPDVLILRGDESGEYYVRFSKELVAKCAHEYLLNHAQSNTTLMHGGLLDGATVVESWVKEFQSDKSSGFGMQIPLYSWVTGMFCKNDQAWELSQEKILNGFSIEGTPGTYKESEIEIDYPEDPEDQFLIDLEEMLTDVQN